MEKSPIFDKTYKDYLALVAKLDFKELQDRLGIQVTEGKAVIPFFGAPYAVSEDGIVDPSGKKPHLSVSVILCKYLLMCPGYDPIEDNWVSFKDFIDAAPLTDAFLNYTERPIAKLFSGRLTDLERACKTIGGFLPSDEFSYDLSIQFNALPKVPVLLLFNDADDEFPALCLVLFEKRTEKYLDMECVAMVGMLLFEYLKTAVG
jgi:hypothetical protein